MINSLKIAVVLMALALGIWGAIYGLDVEAARQQAQQETKK